MTTSELKNTTPKPGFRKAGTLRRSPGASNQATPTWILTAFMSFRDHSGDLHFAQEAKRRIFF